MNRILVPLDGSEQAETALPLADRLANAFDAEVVLVAVAELAETSSQSLAAEREERAFLDRAASRLKAPARSYVEHAGDPSRGIVEAIEQEKPVMVVMATGEESELKAFLEGSVTRDLLGVSKVPLVLVPQRAQER